MFYFKATHETDVSYSPKSDCIQSKYKAWRAPIPYAGLVPAGCQPTVTFIKVDQSLSFYNDYLYLIFKERFTILVTN